MARVETTMPKKALHSLLAEYPANDFQPLAYYDKHLDCVRVQVKDCSYKEIRLGKVFTVLEANHSATTDFVGFTIKGVRHLVESLGLPSTGPVMLTAFLNALVKSHPEICAEFIQSQFGSFLQTEIKVDDFEYARAA